MSVEFTKEFLEERDFLEVEVDRLRPAQAQLKQQVDQLAAENDALLANLARSGVGIDQGSINAVRLGVLTDVLFGNLDGTVIESSLYPRLDYELRVQQTIAKQLAEVKSQATRHALLQGVNVK